MLCACVSEYSEELLYRKLFLFLNLWLRGSLQAISTNIYVFNTMLYKVRRKKLSSQSQAQMLP